MILNVYKEAGWTSFDVVAKMRSILNTKKIGHTGTLDPLAEGVLVVLSYPDTKKQDSLMKSDKEYIAEIVFGCETPTYDLEFTPTLSSTSPDINVLNEKLKNILSKYVGNIEQTVPAYSAKKVGGRPLYKSARSGTLDLTSLPKKSVSIYELEVIDTFEQEIETGVGKKLLPHIKLRVLCSSGTYIRSLASDIGKDLETGGVLKHLLRTRVGDFFIEDAEKLVDLEKRLKG